jgi:hypothetical protein
VPKYDPFGREIGEDTLAGLGGDPSARERAAPAEGRTEEQRAEAASFEPLAEPEPAVAAETPLTAPQRPQPAQVPRFEIPTSPAPTSRARRRGSTGCLGLVIVMAVIAAVPILAIVSFVGSAGDAIDEIKDAFESAPSVDLAPEGPESPGAPPTGIAGRSMVAPDNFGGALMRLRGMGRVATIRLSPDRLGAELVKGSRHRSAVVGLDGGLSRSVVPGATAGVRTLALSAIDRRAPARLVRGAAAKYPVRARGINYLLLTPWPGEGHRWVAYFKNGVYVQGDRKGRVVRRIS